MSQQASNFLSELAVNLNRTQATSDDVEMTEASAASPAAAPPTAEVPKKKPSSKKAAIDSEEETVKAVVAMDEVQAPPKKSKGNEAASTASPAPAPRAPSATEGGDLAMALKKKPKKAGAAATK